jgi:hypothetical protein
MDRDDPRAASFDDDLSEWQWSDGHASRYIPDAIEADPHAINPVGSTVTDNTATSRNVDGCLVSDQARNNADAGHGTGTAMTWPPFHDTADEYYSVGLHSLQTAAEIFYRAGKTDAYTVGDDAIKRAHDWVKRIHGVDGKWYATSIAGDTFLKMAKQMGAIPNYRYANVGYPVHFSDPVTSGAQTDGSVTVPAAGWTHMTGGGGTTGSFIQVVGTASGDSVSSRAITVPAGGIPAGRTLVAVGGGTAEFDRIVDSKGNVYVKAGLQNNGGTRANIMFGYVDTALDAGDTITIHFGASATTAIARVLEFSGLSRKQPLDRTKGANGSATTISTGAFAAATMEANELLVMCYSQNGTTTFTAGTDWTEAGDQASQGTTFARTSGAQYRFVTSSSAYTGSGTTSATGNWGALMAAFRLEAA